MLALNAIRNSTLRQRDRVTIGSTVNLAVKSIVETVSCLLLNGRMATSLASSATQDFKEQTIFNHIGAIVRDRPRKVKSLLEIIDSIVNENILTEYLGLLDFDERYRVAICMICKVALPSEWIGKHAKKSHKFKVYHHTIES